MNTTAEIPCLVEVRTEELAKAIANVCGDSVTMTTAGRKRRGTRTTPLVFFFETTTDTSSESMTYTSGIAYALVLAPKPGGEYPVPTGVSEVLTGNTAQQLGKTILRKLQVLSDTAEQRIAVVETGRNDVEALFLDGARFSVPMDRKHRWNRVAVSPDRRFLILPRVDGDVVDTIPWDVIRQPQSHLDEEERTKRLIARTLRRHRKRAGLSQEKAAQESGVSRQTILRLEKAGNYPGTATLKALARTYGTTLPKLLADLHADS